MIHLLSQEQAFGSMTYSLKRVLGDSPRHWDDKALCRKFRGGELIDAGMSAGATAEQGGRRSRRIYRWVSKMFSVALGWPCGCSSQRSEAAVSDLLVFYLFKLS